MAIFCQLFFLLLISIFTQTICNMINFATAKKRLSLGGSPYEIKHRITRMKTLKKNGKSNSETITNVWLLWIGFCLASLFLFSCRNCLYQKEDHKKEDLRVGPGVTPVGEVTFNDDYLLSVGVVQTQICPLVIRHVGYHVSDVKIASGTCKHSWHTCKC